MNIEIIVISLALIPFVSLYIVHKYKNYKDKKELRKEFYTDFYLYLSRCYSCNSIVTKHCNFCKLQVCPDHSDYITVEDNLVVVCFLCQNLHKPL